MIGKEAFYQSSIESIDISSKIVLIDDSAFRWCLSLENIIVSTENENYQSIDGHLYSKDGTKLIKYASGKEDTTFVVPSSVLVIGKYAFEYSIRLKKIEIPFGVTEIEDYAISWCYNIEEVLISNSVTSIGDGAFSYCYDCLTMIVIPNSVTTMGSGVFEYCPKLEISCEAMKKPIGWNEDWNKENYHVYWAFGTTHSECDMVYLDEIEPTCTKDGLSAGQYCTICDNNTIEQEVIPMLGHNYVESKCTYCGETQEEEIVAIYLELFNTTECVESYIMNYIGQGIFELNFEGTEGYSVSFYSEKHDVENYTLAVESGYFCSEDNNKFKIKNLKYKVQVDTKNNMILFACSEYTNLIIENFSAENMQDGVLIGKFNYDSTNYIQFELNSSINGVSLNNTRIVIGYEEHYYELLEFISFPNSFVDMSEKTLFVSYALDSLFSGINTEIEVWLYCNEPNTTITGNVRLYY